MKWLGQKSSKPAAILSFILLASTIAGCTEGKGAATTPAKIEEKKPPLKVTMISPLFRPEAPSSDNVILKKLEELTNTELDINWVPNQPYDDKQMAMVVSGELPQVVRLRSDRAPGNINAMRSGLFWEIGPYLKDYPNLSKLDPRILETASVDGKTYGIYSYRDLARGGIVYRQDWLDKLKLPVPKTIDDIYKTLRAFTYDDPDGNGKADTFGTGEAAQNRMFPEILAMFGAPNNWEVGADGKFKKDIFSKEYLEALKFMKKLFDEKLINQDFASPSLKPIDHISKGKAGMMFNFIGDAVGVANSLKSIDPKAVIDIANDVKGPNGVRLFANRGYQGIYAFPKTSVKTEKDLKNLLGFMDTMASSKIQNLLIWGIEGTHYKLENNKPVVLNQELKDREVAAFDQLSFRIGDEGAMENVQDPLAVKVKQLQDKGLSSAVFDPSGPLISPTFAEKGTQLTQVITDANIKFIMGVLNEEGWQAEMNRWLKEGGTKITDEMTAEYAKAQTNKKK